MERISPRYPSCTAENPNSRVYNIGTGVGVTLNDIARVIRKHLPRAELGYAPQFDLERGIADYLDSLERLKAS